MVHYESLREFIALADKAGEVKTIRGASAHLEIACINELVSEAGGPLLMFDEIPDYPKGFRISCNVFNTMRRAAMALDLPEKMKPLDMLAQWRQRTRALSLIPPIDVENPSVSQNVLEGKDVDVFKFPAPKWHERDGGQYLGTGALIILKDPEEGWVNVGIYRCMLQDRNTVSLLIGAHDGRKILQKYHARGEKCPVAICVSPDPLLTIVAGSDVPWGQSEYEWTGGLRGKAVRTTKGVYTGLPVPADGEIVFEGDIVAGESADEGPFGEWTGYIAGKYKKEGNYTNLVQVKSIMYANDPIVLGVRPLKPPTPWFSPLPLISATGIWNSLEGAGYRGIRGVWTHVVESFGSCWTVIAIDQLYKGHSKEVGIGASVCPAAVSFGTFFIVVDNDVDITDLKEVLWTVAMRCNIKEDMQTIGGVRQSPLHPYFSPADTLTGMTTGSRVILDACVPFERRNTFPPKNVFPKEYRAEIAKKWGLSDKLG